jgi:hypothetical protein
MPGTAAAVTSGDDLERRVAELARALGLEAETQVRVGRRVWGAERFIDVVITNPADRRRLGVECKFQGGPGSAEEKIPTTILDIRAWPVSGIVVFEGSGFSANMRAYLVASGKAVEMEDLEAWLRLYFGLALR